MPLIRIFDFIDAATARIEATGCSRAVAVQQEIARMDASEALRVRAAALKLAQLLDAHVVGVVPVSGCPECERSHGPHYRGPCEH